MTPSEARSRYEREYQEYLTEAVFLTGTNYLGRVTAAPAEAVARFYTNEMSAYRLPERVQVSYVAFGITNLLAQAERTFTNLTEQVEGAYRSLGTNSIHFGKTPQEAKVKIREELIREQALRDASGKADEFANELFDMNPVQAGNLAALAKTSKVAARRSGE